MLTDGLPTGDMREYCRGMVTRVTSDRDKNGPVPLYGVGVPDNGNCPKQVQSAKNGFMLEVLTPMEDQLIRMVSKLSDTIKSPGIS